MSAAMGIIMDTETKKQTIYGGMQVEMAAKHDATVDQLECHRDDITCLDINKERTKVITG